MMDPDVERLGALAERDYQTYVKTFADTPGVEVVVDRGILYRHGEPLDDDYLNAVFGAHLQEATVADRIADIVAILGAGGRAFRWTLWPSDTPRDLADRLVDAGFEESDAGPIMALELASYGNGPPVPPGLVLHEATTMDEIRRVSGFVVASTGAPDDGTSPFAMTFERLALEPARRWRMFGGEVDGTLVSSSALFTGTGVAGIYAVATTEAHRGRGYGGAVTAAAIDAGRELGADVAVLLASTMGYPVYRRLGFRDVGRVRFLRWAGAGRRNGTG